MKQSKLRNTINHLARCRAACRRAKELGIENDPVFLMDKGLTNDPRWLVNMAINRRAGWPDDPSLSRGSAMPVNGRFPKKAGGDWYRHLRLIAGEVNTRRLVVHESRLGEHRWLIDRLPNRFTSPLEAA